MGSSRSDNSTSISKTVLTNFLIGISAAAGLFLVDWKSGDYAPYYFYLGVVLLPVIIGYFVAVFSRRRRQSMEESEG